MTAPASNQLLISCPVHGCRGWARTDSNRAWKEEQRCPECRASFTVSACEVPATGEVRSAVPLLRLPTYDHEHVEVVFDGAFVIALVGRLDLFASEALVKAWKSVPSPRRAVFDLTRTTEVSPKGVAVLLGLCTPGEEDGRAVILLRAQDAEQESTFAGAARVFREAAAARTALGEPPGEPRPTLTVAVRREEAVPPSIAPSKPASPARRRRIEVEEIGDVLVVNFVDKKILDEKNIQIIGDQLFALVDEDGRRKILLNFGNVEYMSSASFGKFITLHRKVQAAKGKLIFCNIIPQIYEAFEINRTNKFFNIQKDEQSGLQAF